MERPRYPNPNLLMGRVKGPAAMEASPNAVGSRPFLTAGVRSNEPALWKILHTAPTLLSNIATRFFVPSVSTDSQHESELILTTVILRFVDAHTRREDLRYEGEAPGARSLDAGRAPPALRRGSGMEIRPHGPQRFSPALGVGSLRRARISLRFAK
jgi:hypothetical protein